MIIVTLVRHGQSEDNVQADAIGQKFASIRFTHIYASPLQRAHNTGQAILRYQSEPKPPFTVISDIQEQHFGIAEGHPWTLEMPQYKSVTDVYKFDVFPVLEGRDEKFPEAESLNDVGERARRAVRKCVLPYLPEAGGPTDGKDQVHVVLASHGLCIAELMQALLDLDPQTKKDQYYAGLQNTAWTRLSVSVKGTFTGSFDLEHPPPLDVRVLDVNNTDHLSSLVLEPNQLSTNEIEADAYFAGGGAGEKIPAQRGF